MRSIRLLVAGLAILALAACATSTPGWTYAPAPSPTPVPSAEASPSAAPSGSAAPSASVAPSAATSPATSGAPGESAPPSASAPTTVVELSAQNVAFDKTELSVPADQAFQIGFANNDASVDHNVEIRDTAGATIFQGEVFPGVDTRTYDVRPLPAGSYEFICSVHPNMVGTLTAQ
jgi:plastocyanin